MSAANFYLEKGYTPITKFAVRNAGTGTISLWVPPSDKRVVITNLSIASNLGGTVAFYFDNGDDRFAAFYLGASITIAPDLGAIESTVVGGRIFCVFGGHATQNDGAYVSASGFELGGR